MDYKRVFQTGRVEKNRTFTDDVRGIEPVLSQKRSYLRHPI